jgi:endonuclease/exonuclease/phosphatase family metal-dependent hydrolase
MTAGLRTYEIHGSVRQFTPYGLTVGRTYWFQVRALNSATPSSYTSPVALTPAAAMQPISVMTYNILQLTWDGTTEHGNVISPWSRRGPVAAALIKKADPDVVAVQEGWPWAGQPCGPRQVDSLRAMLGNLGAQYYVARTEVPPCETGYRRRGDYILYKASAYASVHAGGTWDIGNGRNAAWQELQNRTTGARVLVVCAHLAPPQGHTYDLQRQSETQTLLRLGGAKAASLGVPVIYAGDFNSDAIHSLDAPAVVMRAAHFDDARAIAQTRRNVQYDSMNQYRPSPPAYGLDIDYVWAGSGTAVTYWTTLLNVSAGHWVGTIPSDHNPIVAHLQIPY